MTRQEQNHKIDAAIALLREVADVQNTTKEWCDSCHGAEYEDYSSYQLGTGLESVIKKLRKLSWHDLEAGEPETHAPGRRA
jgi:hypothetical protein